MPETLVHITVVITSLRCLSVESSETLVQRFLPRCLAKNKSFFHFAASFYSVVTMAAMHGRYRNKAVCSNDWHNNSGSARKLIF